MDADGALACVKEFDDPACVIVKHANPCGVSIGTDLLENYNRAFNADSVSAFGGIVALNRICTGDIAEAISKVFVEIVLAPAFDKKSLEIFKSKNKLRVLEIGGIKKRVPKLEIRNLDGGILVQDVDNKNLIKNSKVNLESYKISI